MSLALAIKRAYRSFDPSPRRWVGRYYNFIFFYLVGLYTGLLASGHDASLTTKWFVAIFVVMIGLKWWAGIGSVVGESSERVCPQCGSQIRQKSSS